MRVNETLFFYVDPNYPTLIQIGTYNYWAVKPNQENPNLYLGEYSAYFLIGTRAITQDFPDFDADTLKLTSLQATLKKEIADSHVKQENLKEQIQALLCLTHDDKETF